MSKLRLDLSDPETRAVWETCLRAKQEVASWPAWKRGDDMPKKMDLPPEAEGLSMEEAMELIDGPAELAAPDQIPHLNQCDPVASYRDWKPEQTRVIRCRIGNDIYFGNRYESREEAKAAVEATHGRVLEVNYLPGQAFFRVFRK